MDGDSVLNAFDEMGRNMIGFWSLLFVDMLELEYGEEDEAV